LARETGNAGGARAHVSRTGKLSDFTTPTPQASAPCQFQFATVSVATLSQQEKNKTEDLQRG
jgi:hypothetical protein